METPADHFADFQREVALQVARHYGLPPLGMPHFTMERIVALTSRAVVDERGPVGTLTIRVPRRSVAAVKAAVPMVLLADVKPLGPGYKKGHFVHYLRGESHRVTINAKFGG